MTNVENLIIIWSGPAGHTAAIYAARANLSPLMFEWWMAGGIAAGGQLTTTTEVENFPGFPTGVQWPELMDNMRKQSLHNGTRIVTKTVDKVDLSKSESKFFKVWVGSDVYETKAIIIATGATAKKLDIPGVKEYWMRGISGCAVCDGALPIFRDKPLVVIWGGDVAMEEAMHLAKFGSQVTVLLRGSKASMKASKAMQDRAFANPKISFMEHTEATAVRGEQLLTQVDIVNNQTQEVSTIPANGLFFAIGHTPNTGFLDGQVQIDEIWYIITEKGTTKTSIEGVFAAGDVQDHIYRQAITSAGTGCMAALEAEKYVSEM